MSVLEVEGYGVDRTMTLVLALVNEDQAIQIADRRLVTLNNGLYTEEFNKATLLRCENARVVIGFAGPAIIEILGKRLSIQSWLLDALTQSAPPDYSIGNIIKRFSDYASRSFSISRPFKSLPAHAKHLSFMLSGYLTNCEPPRAINAVIKNFEEPSKGVIRGKDQFTFDCVQEKRPCDVPVAFQRFIGIGAALDANGLRVLFGMLESRKPRKAIVGKAIELFERAASSKAARNRIGKQLNIVTVPRDSTEAPTGAYYSNKPSYAYYMPDFLNLTKRPNTSFKDIKVYVENPDANTKPMVVAKTRPDARCPCGSGRKYKNCHGKYT